MKQSSESGHFLVLNTDWQDFKNSLLIHDYIFWTTHEKEIDLWCNEMFGSSIHRRGMFLRFESSEDRTLFLIKWQNV